VPEPPFRTFGIGFLLLGTPGQRGAVRAVDAEGPQLPGLLPASPQGVCGIYPSSPLNFGIPWPESGAAIPNPNVDREVSGGGVGSLRALRPLVRCVPPPLPSSNPLPGRKFHTGSVFPLLRPD
ncbi:hypothetical protein chiPu_0028217, partial [Chiloscyllium punctatum]|nr:hypothetical protein [Chiloscyllium punctatum]